MPLIDETSTIYPSLHFRSYSEKLMATHAHLSSKLGASLFCLSLALGACGSAQETPDPTGTPTAVADTPTPTPTPAPGLDDWQMMTSLQVAPKGGGLDLDGDGRLDNGIYAGMKTLETGIINAIEAWNNSSTDFPGQTDICEEEDAPGCTGPKLPPEAMAAIEQVIGTLVSVDAINRALAAPYEAGQYPYALHLYGTSPDHTLDYYTGELTNPGYVTDALIGSQKGNITLDGTETHFGPGSYTFSVSLQPPQGEPLALSFALYTAQSQFIYDPAGLDDAYTGGGVSIYDMLDLAETVLEFIDGMIINIMEDQDPLDVDGILAQLEDELQGAADISCMDGGQCISMSLIYDTTPKALAP